MDQLTFSLARENGRDGKHITINTIAPGPVETDNMPPGPEVAPLRDLLLSVTRSEERMGTVEDVADAVPLLTSEKRLRDSPSRLAMASTEVKSQAYQG